MISHRNKYPNFSKLINHIILNMNMEKDRYLLAIYPLFAYSIKYQLTIF